MAEEMNYPGMGTQIPAKKERSGISGSTLKIIAIVTMLIDHIGASVLGRLLQTHGINELNVADISALTQGMERKPFQEIKKIIEQEPCILIGRCGNYITKDRTDTLRVFIHADDKFRAERVAKENGITEEKAAKKIVETDKARASFYRFYTNGEWDQASGYDLVLNSSMFGIDQCVDMIIKSMDR